MNNANGAGKAAKNYNVGTGGILVVVFVVIVCTLVITWLISTRVFGLPKGPGEFGDMFGAANAIFSGMALVGVVYAVILQNRELRHQATELARTTEELKQQTKYLHHQTRQLRLTAVHEVLSNVILEYRTVEMFSAVRHLWAFYRANPDNLVEAYAREKKADEERIASLPGNERLAAEALTLHYRRQLVSRFYHFVAGLKMYKVLPADMLYMYWRRGDLRIIPEVLMPIEDYLSKLHNTSQSKIEILTLYEESPGEN